MGDVVRAAVKRLRVTDKGVAMPKCEICKTNPGFTLVSGRWICGNCIPKVKEEISKKQEDMIIREAAAILEKRKENVN